MSEFLSFSLRFAVVGILIVFAALAVISIAVSLIRRADDRWQAMEEARHRPVSEEDATIDNTTLVLIAAAAATMIQGRFHIRRVRRLMRRDAYAGPWSQQGRAVLLGSHVISHDRS